LCCTLFLLSATGWR